MISGRTLLCSLFVLTFVALQAGGDDGSGASAFCERARSEFNSLLRSCPGDRRAYWKQRSNEALEKSSAKLKELQATQELLARQPDGKKLQEVFTFDYLSQIYEVELNENIRLVEDLGRELLNDRSDAQLMPELRQMEAQFAALQGKSEPENVRNSYLKFLDLKRSVSRLEADAPVKETYVFEPRANAYATEPIKTVRYEMHDWNAALANVDRLKQELQPIQDSLVAARLFSPKDPLPWLTVIIQVTYLLVVIAASLRSYHNEKAYWPIVLLVVLSMLLSIFLVFYSDETWWNVLRQSIVPTAFLLQWIITKRKRLPSTRINPGTDRP